MDKRALTELIRLSKQNDTRAFRQIVSEHQQLVYAVSFRLLCNEEDAKDIVQETFIRVWQHLHTFDPEKKFSTWLYTIATNLCLDKLKTNKRNHTEFIENILIEQVSSENCEQEILYKELGKLIASLTDQLTPKQKVVFTLRYLEDLEPDEIEKITGLSPAKIKSNLYLARQIIRKTLEKSNYGYN